MTVTAPLKQSLLGLGTKMDAKLCKQIVDILEKVQTNSACHQKYVLVLLNIYNGNKQAFYEYFEKLLTILLNEDPKNRSPYAEKACNFCASFCAAVESNVNLQVTAAEKPLSEKVFDFLLDLHNLEQDAIRYRVCQMMNKLLSSLTGAELNEDLCDRIEEAMLQRLQDSKAEVRFQAVAAIYRLQNPLDSQCKVTPELIRHMNGDLSGKVRKICIEKVAIRRDVVAALVVRTRDINIDVRLAAFTRISKLVKHLKIKERHKVIIHGFSDGAKEIKNFVETYLVSAWLDDYDNDYLKLLDAVRWDSTEDDMRKMTMVMEHILSTLFRPCEEILDVLNVDDERMVALQDLNSVSAVYWRCLVETLQKSDEYESLLNSILPDLIHFAVYIQKYCQLPQSNKLEFQFILNQLFIITQGYDISDPVSRQVLIELIIKILRDVDLDPNTVTTVIKNLDRIFPNVEQWTKCVCEIISDIMHPISGDEKKSQETEFQIAQLKLKLNCVQEEQNSAVKAEDYVNAARCKQELNQLKESLSDLQQSLAAPQAPVMQTDVPTVLKCLTIARGLLVSRQVTTLSPMLRTLNDDVVLEFLAHEDSEVRVKALECYALACTVDKKSAHKGIHIFSACMLANTMAESPDVPSLLVAIKAINDLLVIYGQALMQPSENEGALISYTQVIQALVDLMDNENAEIQDSAGLSLCNLISYGRVHSASLISRMILKWCNPTSEETPCLRQNIGMMLEELPTLRGSASQLEKAVLPTIKTLLKAPESSPLSDVDIQDVLKFMLALCSICEEAPNLHSSLAVAICGEMKDDPNHSFNTVFSKVLLMLDLSSDDKQLISGLINICDEIRNDVRNRVVSNNILKFVAHLESLNTHDISTINEEVEE